MIRKASAELLGTALLVYFGVGAATLSFGKGFLANGLSFSAGVVATALTFGLVLMALAYSIGPISGCHVNPAVTLGALIARRISISDAVVYWVAQFVGGIIGALVLWATFSTSPLYSRKITGSRDRRMGIEQLHSHRGGRCLPRRGGPHRVVRLRDPGGHEQRRARCGGGPRDRSDTHSRCTWSGSRSRARR